jgi:cysteinyl-tRNA synthetase
MNLTDIDDKTIRGPKSGGLELRDSPTATSRPSSPISTPCGWSAPSTTRAPPTTSRRWSSWSSACEPPAHLPQRRLGLLPHRTFPGYGKLSGVRPEATWSARGSTATSTRRRTPATSCSGRGPRRASRCGRPPSAPAGPVGTSSAPPCRWPCSARPSTSTAAASTTSSPTTRTRSPSPRAPPGKPFARYWLHAEHLVVEGEKMAKSKGNFFTLRDLVAKGHDPWPSATC